MSARTNEIAALVFDLDGLFADTQTVWTKAQERLFAAYGKPYGPKEESALLGVSREACGLALAAFLGRPQREAPRLYKRLHELGHKEIAAGVKPMPGAFPLVRAAKRRGIQTALASNGPADLVAETVVSIGAAELFDAIVTADDVMSPKPAPDVYLEACRRLSATPAHSVALEDSPTGIEAALAAGLRVIAVPSPGVTRVGRALLVVSSLDDALLWTTLGL